MTRARTIWRVLTKKRGSPLWDGVVRGTGVVGLIALYPAARWPDVAAFAGFVCLTLALNGPLSPVLPAAYEPVLMVMGRVYSPVLVALLGILAILYIELLNYHLYRLALRHRRLDKFRESRLVSATVKLFKRSPFFCVWLAAWSPLPYWTVRLLAPIAGYPVGKYLVATFLGRGPRLWFFAALGGFVPISTAVLAVFTIVMVLVGVGGAAIVRRVRARRLSPQPAGAGL